MYYSNSFRNHGSSRRGSNDTQENQRRRIPHQDSTRSLTSNNAPSIEGEGGGGGSASSTTSKGSSSQERQRRRARELRRERSKKKIKGTSKRNVQKEEEENELLLWEQQQHHSKSYEESDTTSNTAAKKETTDRKKWRMSITEEDLEIETKRRGSFSSDFFYGEHLGLLEKRRRSKEKEGLVIARGEKKKGLAGLLKDGDDNSEDDDDDNDEDSIEDVFSVDTSTLSHGTGAGGTGAPYDSSVPVDSYDPISMKRVKKTSERSVAPAPTAAEGISSYFKAFRRGSTGNAPQNTTTTADGYLKDAPFRRNSTGLNSSKDGLAIDDQYHPDKNLFDNNDDDDDDNAAKYHDSIQTVSMSYWESSNDFDNNNSPSMMKKLQHTIQSKFPSTRSLNVKEDEEGDSDDAHDEEKHYDYNYGNDGIHFPKRHYRSNNRPYGYGKEEEEYDRRIRYSFTEQTMKNTNYYYEKRQYKWFGNGLCCDISRRIGAGFGVLFVIVGVIGLLVGLGVEEINVHNGIGSTRQSTVPFPPMKLAESCRMDKHACILGCAPGSCCFMHPINDANNCFRDNEHVCSKYEPCHILLDEMGSHGSGSQITIENQASTSSGLIYSSLSTVPEPPTNLPQICSLFSGDAGTMNAVVQNPTECRSTCLTASCCLESGPNLNCASNPHNTNYCPIYQTHCSNLSPPMLDLSNYDGMIPPPPHNLRSICSLENTSTENGKEQCEDVCDVGLCCVGMANPIDCALLPPEQKAPICLAYKRHCATVWPSEVYAEEKDYIPKPLEQWCSSNTSSNVDPERKRKVCTEICEEVKCCWEDGPNNCQSFNGDKCDAYSFCSDYQTEGEAAALISAEDVVDVSTFPPIIPEESIADHCSPTSIANPDVLEDCKSMCTGGGCCLYPSSSTESDCFLEYGDICALYQPCLDPDLNLDLPPYDDGWSTHTIPKSPAEYLCQSNDALATTTTAATTDEARQICLDVCSAGSCCYDDDPSTNCFTENEDICWFYEPCRANAIVPPAPMSLDETCNFDTGDEMGKEDCIHACQPSACCWEGLKVDENGYFEPGLCYKSNEATCLAYKSPCSVVEPYLGYGMGWQAESGLLPLLEACSSHNLETDEGVARCREECEPSWCCIAEDPLSCREVYPHFCNQYEPICGPLLRLGLLDIDEYDDEDINTICSMKNVITVQGKARCEEECAAASCCYFSESGGEQNGSGGGQKKYGCHEEKAEWCEEMAACDVLIEVTALTSKTENGIEIDESTVLIPYAPSNIESLCAKDKVSTFTGRLECEDVCLPSECCYDDEGPGGCRQANSGACDSYSPWCDTLVS